MENDERQVELWERIVLDGLRSSCTAPSGFPRKSKRSGNLDLVVRSNKAFKGLMPCLSAGSITSPKRSGDKFLFRPKPCTARTNKSVANIKTLTVYFHTVKLSDYTHTTKHLEDCSLVLATCSVETREALASSSLVVTQSSSGAVAAGFIAITIQRVTSRGALLKITCSTAISSVAKASYMLHSIPWLTVGASSFSGKELLGPASSAVIAIVRTNSSLTSHSIITRKAIASTRGSVTNTFV